MTFLVATSIAVKHANSNECLTKSTQYFYYMSHNENLTWSFLKNFLIIIFINNKLLFLEIAIELYKLGARVVLCSRDENKLNSVKNELMNVRFKPFI